NRDVPSKFAGKGGRLTARRSLRDRCHGSNPEPNRSRCVMNPNVLRALCTGFVITLAAPVATHAQEILLQEGFNTDGDTSTPRRYTLIGRDVYEPDRIVNELGIFDQKGPVYWAHNFDVSYVGNPT